MRQLNVNIWCFVTLLLSVPFLSNAQFAWFEPAVPDVTQEVTIYIDTSQDPDCSSLTGNTEQLYLWTWMPAGPNIADGNGTWGSSNEEMALTNVDGDLWSFTMIPTEFYGLDADAVYENGFSFLAKRKDGGGGGDCSAETGGEFKTSDVNLPIPSPFATTKKVFSIPEPVDDSLYISREDIFSIVYDNNLEEKATMLGVSNMWVYLRFVGSDGNTYNYASLSQIGNTPELEMTTSGNGKYYFSIIPKIMSSNVLPEGVELETIRCQLVTWPLCGSDCAVEGEFQFTYKCPE